NPLTKGFIASCIISFFHIISALAVVTAYVLLSSFLAFSIPYINYIAGTALLVLALRLWFERPSNRTEDQHGHIHDYLQEGEHTHEHEHLEIGRHTHNHRHRRKILLTLKGIAIFALILGFAHEEEFALLALAVGGVNPLFMMLTYASAVTLGIVGITLIGVKTSHRLQARFERYEHLLPKISATILAALAISFLLGLR
ncbi:MAG: nickel/cobalt transporter, partial [Nitrososphaerales archaeon]